MIELRSLGTAEIRTGTATLTPSQEVVFAAALYLVLEIGRPLSRSHLALLLWPGVPESARAHRMRQTLLQLKKLGLLIESDRDKLELSRGDVRRDIDMLSEADGAKADRHGCLEFLPGYSPRLSEGFRDWVDEKRGEANAAATRILLSHLERSRLEGDWSSVERVSVKCLSLDPYNETAVLAQAEAAAMRGGKKQAVAILDAYIADLGSTHPDLKLPASLLRRRVVERVPDRPALLNSDPPFVGREAEMAVLTERLVAARAGRGSATLILGEAGIGKSRLSAELGRFAELQGARVLRVGCRRTDISRPLSLFVDMVPELREMPGALGCGPETFVWLKRLTEFEQRPDSSRDVHSTVLFHNVRSAIYDLVDSVAHEGLLVIELEDMQWVDDESARMLVGMAQWCTTRRVFFVMNARPETTASLIYAQRANFDLLALGPLHTDASTALLQSIALRPSDEPQPDFVSWCLTVAEGNPFFLQELAHQWIETGQRHEAPPSVSNVLQDRLSRLSDEALRFFQCCAVLGDYSSVDRVEAMLKYPPYTVMSAVEELSKAAMLVSSAPELNSLHFRVRHDFLSSAALSRLSPASLAFMHRRSAEVLEREFAGRGMPANLLWTCADHREKAGDREHAISLSRSCAEHLLEVGLPRDACAALRRSAEYCISDAHKLEVLPRLAFAYELAGEWEKCKETLSLCIQLSNRDDPHTARHSDYELLLLNTRHRSGVDSVTLPTEAIECVKDTTASAAHRVEAAILVLKLAMDLGDIATFSLAYDLALPLLSDESVSERSRCELQIIYRTTLRRGLVTIAYLDHFTRSARETTGELGYSRALTIAASACRLSGRYKQGLGFLSTALDHANRRGFLSRCTDIKMLLVQMHICGQEFETAADLLAQLRTEFAQNDNARFKNEINCTAARIAIHAGDFKVALDEFRQIDRDLIELYSVTRRGYYFALQLRIQLHDNSSDASIRKTVEALERTQLRMRSFGLQDFEIYALYLGLCKVGRRARGVRLLKEYLLEYRNPSWDLPSDLAAAAALNDLTVHGQVEEIPTFALA